MKLRIGRDRLMLLSFFIGTILLGSFLLVLPGMYKPGPLGYLDALFTSTSAVCVTGLIVVDTAAFTRLGQTVIMLLIQVGGLGIITFATLYLAMPRRRISIIGRGLVGEYSLAGIEHKPKAIIGAIVKYTFFFEAIGALFYALRFRSAGIPAFDAVFHGVSAFCNAGFSTFSDSLESFVGDPIVNLTTIALIITGGIGFIVIRDVRKLIKGEKNFLTYHSQVVLGTTLMLIMTAWLAFLVLEWNVSMGAMSFPQKLLASLFQAVTPRTAGFDTIPQSALSHGSQLLTMMLMFVGASPASTGGGIKTTTLFVILLTALRYKDSSQLIHMGTRSIKPSTVYKAIGVVVKGLIIVFTAGMVITMLERAAGSAIPLADAVFEAFSAFGTVGLSKGITMSLHGGSKLLVIATMFVGRVGLFALALPKSSRDVEGYARRPSADIMI